MTEKKFSYKHRQMFRNMIDDSSSKGVQDLKFELNRLDDDQFASIKSALKDRGYYAQQLIEPLQQMFDAEKHKEELDAIKYSD